MQALKKDMKNLSYLIVGGDDRFVELAKLYKLKGYNISTYGMDKITLEGIKNFGELDTALESSEIVIGPIPFASGGNKVNAKYSSKEILIDELLGKACSDKVLLIGAINNYSRKLTEQLNLSYIDYYTDESYQIMNTIPTVEGTLAIMINETSTTVYGSKVLVLGYGRIGKLLSGYLKTLGAEVYVEARKESDLAWIEARSMNAVPLDELDSYIGKMNIIINTIPAMILDRKLLDKLGCDTLLIDLASMPGGIDFDHAAALGLKAIHALGIPGKVACKSAAQYIYDTIQRKLSAL